MALNKGAARFVRPHGISESIMKHNICRRITVAVAVLSFCLALRAQTTPQKSDSLSASATPSGSAAASPAKGIRPLPFHGMISAVDQDAKTFTLASKKMSRVFKITDKTAITKGAAAATLQDITPNEEASGSYWRRTDGTLEAKNVKLGPMARPKSPTPSPKP
jgi:hypothetical protein